MMMNRDNDREDEVNENAEINQDEDAMFDEDDFSNDDADTDDNCWNALTSVIEGLERNELDRLFLGEGVIAKNQFDRLCAAIEKSKNHLTQFSYCTNSLRFVGFEHALNYSLTEKLLSSVAKCNNLIILELSNSDISWENMHLIADIIRNNNKLIHIDFALCQIPYRQTLLTLAQVFGEEQVVSASQLENLDLSNINFDLMSLDALTMNLKHIKSLKKLNLCACQINDEMIISIADLIVNSNLKEINLSNNQITHVGIQHLCDALTKARMNTASVNLIKLDLNQNPIGSKGYLAFAEFIKNGGQLKLLSLTTLDHDDIDDDSFLALIAASNQNPHLRTLVCFKEQGWRPAVMRAVSNQLKSNVSLTEINLGEWDEYLIIDMLQYNFTLLNIFGWQTSNIMIGLQGLYGNRENKINLSLALNSLLSQLLNKFVFANIEAMNQIFNIMETKQLLVKDHLPKSLIEIFNSILTKDKLGEKVIVNMKPSDRTSMLRCMSDILKSTQSSDYPVKLETFLNYYNVLVNSKQKQLPTLYIPNSQLGFSYDSYQIIKNCKGEALELATANAQINQTVSLIPIIALQLPSLKDLCFHVVSLQILTEFTLSAWLSAKANLPSDLADELNHVLRLLPKPVVNTLDEVLHRGPTLFGWSRANLGVVLQPTKDEDECDNHADHEAKKESKNEAIVTRNFRLGNSRH